MKQASTKDLLREDPTSYEQILGSWIALDKGPWLKPSVAKTTTKLNIELLSNKKINENLSRIIIKVINSGTVPSFMTQVNISGVKRCFYASDNYTWLAPGETKVFTLDILWREESKKAMLSIHSWNAEERVLNL